MFMRSARLEAVQVPCYHERREQPADCDKTIGATRSTSGVHSLSIVAMYLCAAFPSGDHSLLTVTKLIGTTRSTSGALSLLTVAKRIGAAFPSGAGSAAFGSGTGALSRHSSHLAAMLL